MNHFIAIFVQDDIGEWRVVFPDMPGCEARGFSLDDAKFAATTALLYCVRNGGAPAPQPMSMAVLQEDWLTQNKVDLSRAIVTTISVEAEKHPDSTDASLDHIG